MADYVIMNDVRQFGANVANTWVEGLAAGQPATLLGKPIFEANAQRYLEAYRKAQEGTTLMTAVSGALMEKMN